MLESPPSRPSGFRLSLLVDSVIVLAMILTIIVSATNKSSAAPPIIFKLTLLGICLRGHAKQ